MQHAPETFFLGQRIISTVIILYKDDVVVGLIIPIESKLIESSSHSVSDRVSKRLNLIINHTSLYLSGIRLIKVSRSSSKLQGFKWLPVLQVWEQLQDNNSKEIQNSSRWKPLVILMQKYTPRVPRLLPIVKKIEHENLDFALLLLCSYFLLSFFLSFLFFSNSKPHE